MQVHREIVGIIERESTRAKVPAKRADHFGNFGFVRYSRNGRWSEITTDVVMPKAGVRSPLLVIGLHNSEEPARFACATMGVEEARELRALLDRAIEAATAPPTGDTIQRPVTMAA